MNPHIELVRKWLADNSSVSNKELESNAYDAADVAGYVDAYGIADAAADAAYALAADVIAYVAADVIAYVAADSAADAAAYALAVEYVAEYADADDATDVADAENDYDSAVSEAKRYVQIYDELIKQGE